MDAATAKAVANQLGMGTIMLLGRQAQRREHGIQLICDHAQDVCAESSCCVRSMCLAIAWMVQLLAAGFCDNLYEYLAVLRRLSDLYWVGLSPAAPIAFCEFGVVDQGRVFEDDEWVESMSKLALRSVALRLERCAYMLGGYSCCS